RNNQHGFYESVSKERLPIVEDSPAPGDLSIALVSSAWEGKTNIMTMGWHMMLEFDPALFGCYIWDGNHSFEMIRRSKECVINIPTADLIDQVVSIGNTSGRDVDKFKRFKLTPVLGSEVNAPLIE